MNGTNGNQPGYPENALVPYPVIVAATKGDPDAMKMVLQHFSGYIARLSMRKLYDERGNVYFGIDNDSSKFTIFPYMEFRGDNRNLLFYTFPIEQTTHFITGQIAKNSSMGFDLL